MNDSLASSSASVASSVASEAVVSYIDGFGPDNGVASPYSAGRRWSVVGVPRLDSPGTIYYLLSLFVYRFHYVLLTRCRRKIKSQ